jgi:hypothetical protein
LLWGDVCGYVWGPIGERLEIPIKNERERQTYFGAVNLATGQCLVQRYGCGNGEYTMKYLQYLMSQCPEQRLVLIWDGSIYHRSQEIKAFLASVNDGLTEVDWTITLLQFAPNDPTQNPYAFGGARPYEDIWLAAKKWIRTCWHQCRTFDAVKVLFELTMHYQIFKFPKLHRLGKFSLIN